jgi:hypothetical protein
MYNYSIDLTYRIKNSDRQYRNEILAVFNVKEYNEEIIDKQEKLLEKVESFYIDILDLVKTNDRLALIRNINKNDCFCLLFSWDYFFENHSLLKAIFNKENKEVINTKKDILKKVILKSNNVI